MCGLAGVFDATGVSGDALVDTATAMGCALRHRGPDDDGVWCDPAAGVALAHRRLAILDLSERGRQPMVSADDRYVIVFNGEIYNHQEMARRLVSAGVVLRGHSDTEVLLETIARESLEVALARSNGMFALALWDRRRNTLTLARDRLGEKPLYYAYRHGRLLFGSELAAMRRVDGWSPSIDNGALALFVRHSYVPGPHTVYAGVRKLPPGHVVRFVAGMLEEPSPQAFWRLRDAAEGGRDDLLRLPDEALVSQVEELIHDAVRIRMVSDVPLGAFLSGGVDSSLVVAVMQAVSERPVRTFTISVGGQYDESAHAAAIARHLRTDHTELPLAESDALELVSEIAGLYDEPFADPSAVPTALVSTAARRHVTVCLTGDGGDEVFAGYNRYQAADGALSRAMRLPPGIRAAVTRGILRVPPHRWDGLASLAQARRRVPDVGTKMHKLARVLGAADSHGAYRALTSHLDPESVLLSATEAESPATEPAGWLDGLDPLHRMLYLDGVMTLPDNMLVKVDRASMAVGLECRVPLLDHRLVELAWRLPRTAKLRHGEGKWVLRRALERHVPARLLDRPKQGFDPPLANWLRGPLREWTGDLLSPSYLSAQGLFQPQPVQALLAEHMSGQRNHDYAIWTLVAFQSWWQRQQVTAST